MRASLGAGAAAILLIFAARAQGGDDPAPTPARAGPIVPATVGWGDFAASVAPSTPAPASPGSEMTGSPVEPAPATEEIDVVDAHWMALTMWGEARGDGEDAMRAVGHVIDNRRRSGGHGPHATDTVSEAWQFSCWNPGDPNRIAMENVDRLRQGSREHDLWLAARRIAGEILAGRSPDSTGGALFYHRVDVAPAWSRGVAPIRRIGDHLFFRTARRA